ncbi:hypothetical protein MLD38_008814 [Melastoma candidum]|uniref:Uncharacterized protein n=1 Tax=Melastoma candidum TaxID=119954 RepID=A0ACB9RV07_9MYRT|nr:hypothetical protein MLD38_008814 [Melastoma candidum]
MERRLHFVLVHGVGNGAWCWYKVRSLLENSGYKVTCVDLKSAGIDPSSPDRLSSFDDYNSPLMDALSALPDDERVVLVGHSAGGLSVTRASGVLPGKIKVAVYVAATMLRNGFCTEEDRKAGLPDLSEFGDAYDLGFGLGSDHPPTSAVLKKSLQRKLAYHMTPPEDAVLASMLLKPGPIQVLSTARFVEDKEVDAVPRVYIKTAHDRIIKPEQQEAMMSTWKPKEVFVVESDHSPFLSAPLVLFGMLVKAAALAE